MSSGGRVLVLYGSQTGNAKSIAETLAQSCASRAVPAVLYCMEDFKQVGCLFVDVTRMLAKLCCRVVT